MSDRVHALAEVWREMIAIDHHKTKDGHFSITKVWSYDHQVKYYASHRAYIGSDLDGDYRSTYAEAENDLIQHLLDQIEKQRKWATDVMASEEWAEWSGQEAKHMLEVIDRNIALIKGENK